LWRFLKKGDFKKKEGSWRERKEKQKKEGKKFFFSGGWWGSLQRLHFSRSGLMTQPHIQFGILPPVPTWMEH
jgi:hypothetical protein